MAACAGNVCEKCIELVLVRIWVFHQNRKNIAILHQPICVSVLLCILGKSRFGGATAFVAVAECGSVERHEKKGKHRVSCVSNPGATETRCA